MYAVIRSGGKQYRVMPGDTVKVEQIVSILEAMKLAKTKEEKQALLRAITTQGDDAALNVIELELNKK